MKDSDLMKKYAAIVEGEFSEPIPEVDLRVSRRYTSALLEALDEGILDPKEIVQMCVNWMSESDVQEMIERNDLVDAIGIETEDE